MGRNLMADYRIVCVDENRNAGHDGHIVDVGTGPSPGVITRRWSVTQARLAIDLGDTFHTVSPSTGRRAEVEKWQCRACHYLTLRSTADAVADNNLDNLSPCR